MTSDQGKHHLTNLEPLNSRVGLAQLTAMGIIAIFVIAAVLYGIAGQRLAGGKIDHGNSSVTSQSGVQPTPPATTSGQGR